MLAMQSASAEPALIEVPNATMVIESCDIDRVGARLICLVRNTAQQAIAEFEYDLRVTEAGRAVPWGLAQGSFRVWGGIEPGETGMVVIPLEGMPLQSRSRDLQVEGAAKALNLDGARVE
jgi:hypothetical protein